jgi:homoserine dehydrogenase
MKTVIQANTYWGTHCTLSDVNITGISHLTQADIQIATRMGEVYCMVGRAKMTGHGLELMTGPERLPQDHPLAKARWCDKALLLTTRSQGDQVHYSMGASASGTPGTTLMDMVLITQNT